MRPPQIVRRPRRVPLSHLRGATPTKAAICCRVSVPNSGSSSSNVRAHTGRVMGRPRNAPLIEQPFPIRDRHDVSPYFVIVLPHVEPNAALQARGAAEATYSRTLFTVACKRRGTDSA